MKKYLILFLTFSCLGIGTAQRRVQNALHFDGFNDIVRAQNKTSTNMKDSAVSVEAWIKPTGFQTSADGGTILARHDEPGNRGFTLACGAEGQLYFGIFGDSSYAQISSAKNVLHVDSWTYVAATYDRFTLRLFVNGNMIDSLNDSTRIADVPFVPLTVGNHNDITRPFWGSIDEARLWSRALSKSEIKDHYQFWYCGFNASLRAYFKFNRGTAGGNNALFFKLPDWSGYNNEGTLHNFQLSGSTSNFVQGVQLNQQVIFRSDTVTACDQYRSPSRLVTWVNSGTYADTVISYHGCDSALQIVLTLNRSSYDTLKIRSCGPYTSPSGKQVFTQSGVYTDVIKNVQACDSILTLIVRIGADSTFKDTQIVCHEFTLPNSKRKITASGLYVDTLKGTFGCDSLVFYPIVILPRSSSLREIFFCDSVFLPSSNRWVHNEGTLVDTLANFKGCDSLLVYQLKSLQTKASFQDFACKYYESPSKKYLWTSSGVYYDTLKNYKSCDSIITVNLTLYPVTDTMLNVTACKSFRAPSRRFFITQSGTYYDTVMNSFGCDSLITIQAEITSFVKDIVQSGDTLKSEQGYDFYQWYTCQPTYQLIPNANAFYFIPTEPGNYAVRMEQKNCSDTSKCYQYAPNHVVPLNAGVLRVYPNPNKGMFYVNAEGLETHKWTCYNAQGQILEQASIEWLEEGKYQFRIAYKGLILLKMEDVKGSVYQSWILTID